MLLTQTASSAPDFILIGAGLVWQTLPAGWVDTSESHYTSFDQAKLCTEVVLPQIKLEPALFQDSIQLILSHFQGGNKKPKKKVDCLR